jgi:hypothetical protein
MYFQYEPLAESEVDALRHHPGSFAPLLPAGVPLDSVVSLLDRGWWQAHDKGELDQRRSDRRSLLRRRQLASRRSHGNVWKTPPAPWWGQRTIPLSRGPKLPRPRGQVSLC